MALTESTTLDEVTLNEVAGTISVTWRDHVFRDGVEIDSARTARTKTYVAGQETDFETDLGEDAVKYISIFPQQPLE